MKNGKWLVNVAIIVALIFMAGQFLTVDVHAQSKGEGHLFLHGCRKHI